MVLTTKFSSAVAIVNALQNAHSLNPSMVRLTAQLLETMLQEYARMLVKPTSPIPHHMSMHMQARDQVRSSIDALEVACGPHLDDIDMINARAHLTSLCSDIDRVLVAKSIPCPALTSAIME